MKHQAPRKLIGGFTLVELMIALTLGLVLVAGVVQLFVSTRQAYRVNDALARIQESGRIALELLSRDIRLAGYSGCGRAELQNINVIANPPLPATGLNTGDGIRGYDEGTYPGANDFATADAITVSGAVSCGAQLTGNMTAQNANIQVSNASDCGWSAGDILLITDCKSMDVFRASNVSNGVVEITVAHAQNVNTSNRLSKAYQDDATMFSFNNRDYFIGDIDGDGVPSLYRSDLGSAPTPLVDGIEGFEMRFLDGANYLDAGAVGNWNGVTAVELSLLIRTTERNTAQGTQTLNFPTWSAAPTEFNDGFLRTVVGTTVSLRNRTP